MPLSKLLFLILLAPNFCMPLSLPEIVEPKAPRADKAVLIIVPVVNSAIAGISVNKIDSKGLPPALFPRIVEANIEAPIIALQIG